MTLNGWLMNFWNDTRLAWDKEEWGGIDRLRLPASEVTFDCFPQK